MKVNSTNFVASFVQWFDADYHDPTAAAKIGDIDRVNWLRCLPFVLLHLGCLGVFLVGWSWTAVFTALGLYCCEFLPPRHIHRYFPTTLKPRAGQFGFAVIGAASAQRGPPGGSQPRKNSRGSGFTSDPHSPVQSFPARPDGGFISTLLREPVQRIRDLPLPDLVWLIRLTTRSLPMGTGLSPAATLLAPIAPG